MRRNAAALVLAGLAVAAGFGPVPLAGAAPFGAALGRAIGGRNAGPSAEGSWGDGDAADGGDGGGGGE